MDAKRCDQFTTLLVEYADGELPAGEAEAVRGHLSECARCRSTVEALNRSLVVVRTIWADAEVETVPSRPRHLRYARWASAIAAAVLLAVGIPAALRYLQPGHGGNGPAQPTLTTAEIENIAIRASISAQLLAAAEYLAENGGDDVARERMTYIVAAYPETDAAVAATSRLKTEGRIQ